MALSPSTRPPQILPPLQESPCGRPYGFGRALTCHAMGEVHVSHAGTSREDAGSLL